jgi:type IV pilus assembly protein PilY1
LTTTFAIRVLCTSLAASLALALPARAEDIDLFTNPSPPLSGNEPNILIVLDNSSNWARNDQAWVGGKQGEAELRSLRALMDDPTLTGQMNLGLFMFSSGGPADSAYPRFHIRPMNATNKAAFKELIGANTGCSDGPNSLNGTPNCILKNFASGPNAENTNSASTRYSAALFEAFKYFGGYTDPQHAVVNNIPGTPIDRTHFGNERYGALDPRTDSAAWVDASTKTHWASPFDSLGNASCAKNYIIFIGNGYPSADVDDTLLTGINGNATTPAGAGNKNWKVANWAKYMRATDVNFAAGRQYITTYTIDVFNAKPDATNQGALLKAMAKYGGGRYFEAKNEAAILSALKEIITEIQAVNSVFASASLPINATNRSQNENQVFIGMFRPNAQGLPRWYGNLKQYQIALFGNDAKLADKNGLETIAASTGFVQACATSFWTVDSGNYWEFSPDSVGSCTTSGTLVTSDSPDGSVVEKGGAGEVLRRGNNPAAVAPFTVNRSMYTCAGPTCGSMVTFNDTNVPMGRTGAANAAENTSIVDFTFGKDVGDENGNNFTVALGGIGVPAGVDEPRPSIHADIAHSRPLPVNFGGTRKVEVFYGANDGPLRAVRGETGQELWSFVAPDHHSKLKRLYANSPLIQYPNQPIIPTALSKDYFFDGSLGVYQNADNSKVWIYATMRRGGRMIYAFDITNPTPVLKWSFGCPNLTNDTGCVGGSGADQIGQTWSVPNVAFIRGYSETDPVVIVGGGYDACEDSDTAVTTCVAPKGRKVFILDANTGAQVGPPGGFDVDGPVAADVTLLSRFFYTAGGNSFVDTAYIATTRGTIYRLDFVDKTSGTVVPAASWPAPTKVASTSTGNRKFLFGPAALAIGTKVYLALGSGDRERPLISNYPYVTPIQNRFYMAIDDLVSTNLDLDGASMANFTAETDCSTVLGAGQRGWYMDENAGTGEQTVTSSVIFGGTIFFSTNRPVAPAAGTCATNLGEARGYAVNLFNASGVIGTGSICGGDRSGVFTGGGIPPSPVVGTVPVTLPDGTSKPINVLIGGIDLKTGEGSPIGAQQPPVPIRQVRSRVYWYPKGDR